MLFDDIEKEMCPADKRAFSSLAHAQVVVTNAVYQHLEEPQTFLFCPTGGAASSCCHDNLSDIPAACVWALLGPAGCVPAALGVRFCRLRLCLTGASRGRSVLCWPHSGSPALLMGVIFSLQIIVLPSALQLCPSPPTCRP